MFHCTCCHDEFDSSPFMLPNGFGECRECDSEEHFYSSDRRWHRRLECSVCFIYGKAVER